MIRPNHGNNLINHTSNTRVFYPEGYRDSSSVGYRSWLTHSCFHPYFTGRGCTFKLDTYIKMLKLLKVNGTETSFPPLPKGRGLHEVTR